MGGVLSTEHSGVGYVAPQSVCRITWYADFCSVLNRANSHLSADREGCAAICGQNEQAMAQVWHLRPEGTHLL